MDKKHLKETQGQHCSACALCDVCGACCCQQAVLSDYEKYSLVGNLRVLAPFSRHKGKLQLVAAVYSAEPSVRH